MCYSKYVARLMVETKPSECPLFFYRGRSGFDRDSLNLSCTSRLRLVKRYKPLTGEKEDNFALAAAYAVLKDSDCYLPCNCAEAPMKRDKRSSSVCGQRHEPNQPSWIK